VKSEKWKSLLFIVYCLEFMVYSLRIGKWKIKKVYGLCLAFGFFGKLRVEESGKL